MSHRKNIFAVIIIVTAVMLYAMNLMIDNPYTHSFVNYYINEKFLLKLPISVEYQSMRIQLLPPAVHLFGVNIKEKADSPEIQSTSRELLSTSQVSLVISPWSLFLAKPQIGDLELHDLRAFWPPPEKVLTALKAFEPQGRETNQESPAQWPPKPSPPFSSMSIHNAAIKVTLPGLSLNSDQELTEETTISTEGVSLLIDFNGWRDIKVNADIKKFSVWDRGRSYFEDATLQLDGALRGDTFRSSSMKLTSPRLTTEGDIKLAIQTNGRSRIIDSITFHATQNSDLDFSLIGSTLDLGSTFGSVSGHTQTQIDIPIATGGEPKLLVKGLVQSRGAVFSAFHLYDSEADLEIDLSSITFKEVRIKSGSKSFGKGQGKLHLDKELNFEFSAKPDKLPFDMLLGVFNVPFDVVNFGLTSQNLELSGKGDPFAMKVTADGILSDFNTPNIKYDHKKFPKSPVCDIHFDLKIDQKKLSYDGTGGKCRGGEDEDKTSFPLEFAGVTTFDEREGMDLMIASPLEFNPAGLSYFSQTPLEGIGSLATRIHGPYDRIVVDTTVSLQSTKIANVPVDALSVDTSIADGAITWKNLIIAPAGSGPLVSKSGSIAFDDNLSMKADIQGSQLNRDFMLPMMKALTGNEDSSLEFNLESLEARLEGPLLKPFTYRGTIAIDATKVKDDVNLYASRIHAKIESRDKDIEVRQAIVTLNTLNARVDASIQRSPTSDPNFLGGLGLSPQDRVSLEIAASPSSQPDDQLQHIPFIHQMAAEYGLKGTVSGQAKLTGDLRKLSGLAKVNIDHVQILSISAPSLTSSIILDGSKLDMIAEQGGNALKGRMNIDLGDAHLPYKWYLTCRNFDARPLLPSVFSKDPRSFAYFTGTWSMEGQFDKWWSSTGTLELRSTRAKYFPPKDTGNTPFEISSSRPIQVEMGKNGWSTPKNQKLVLNSPYGSVDLGLENTQPPKRIGIPISGTLKVESLRSIFPTLEVATGQVQLNGGIFGSVSEPVVDLTITDTKISSETASTWQPLSIGLAEYRPPLKDIQFKTRIHAGGVHVESFTATKGNGAIKSSGFLGFKGATEVTDLGIQFDGASFLYPFPIVKNFDSVIDGEIHIKGQSAPLTATGNIKIRRARSNREIDVREAILASIRSSGARSGPQTLHPYLMFDLSVNADESINFNSRTIQATMSSNLQISGSDVAPQIMGLIEITKGKFFYKRDFLIRRGLINYDDPIKPDPSLDIHALSEVGGYKVSIGISGRASDPIMDFTVDPPSRPDGTAITKLEIITLLNRGSLPDNIGEIDGSAAETLAASEALNLLAGQVEDTVQKVFDLSGQNIIKQFYIDTYAGDEGTPIARFNLPLNITDDLDLVLKVDQNTVNLSSEYSLHDSISLTGGIESSNNETNNGVKRQGSPADTGVDIRFKFAFP